MKLYDSIEELTEAIMSCKDKEEAKKAIEALVCFAVRDKGLNAKDYPPDTFVGSIVISALMLSVKNM